MIAYFLCFLLLSAPVVSHPDAPPARNLSWNKFWSNVTSWFGNLVDTGKKVWNHLGLDQTFPKLTEALDKVIQACKTTWEDLGRGVQFLIDTTVGFWKDTTEGMKGKKPMEAINQLIKNIDDIVDCDYYTFEMMIDTHCNIDRAAFIAAITAIHSQFSPIVTLVDQGPCENDVLPLEVEFDINIATDEGKAAIDDFKKALEEFIPSDESTLEPFLAASQPDAALSVEPSFCEAYEAGRKEFTEATENVKELAEELAELVEAAKEESKNTWSFFQRFIRIFKKDPVQQKKEEKEAELREAEKLQAHGANTILGASEQCAEGTMRGPKRKDTGEPICEMASRRRLSKSVVV